MTHFLVAVVFNLHVGRGHQGNEVGSGPLQVDDAASSPKNDFPIFEVKREALRDLSSADEAPIHKLLSFSRNTDLKRNQIIKDVDPRVNLNTM